MTGLDSMHPKPTTVDPHPSIWSPGFQGLLWTNWLTAINDNVFRWFVIGVGKNTFDVTQHSWVVMVGTALFVAPYFLLASPAGWLADRFQKRHVIIGCKTAEIVVMALGIVAVVLDSFNFLLVTVFLMGAQSTLFAPAKIGAIPELLDEEKISAGNGIFNLATLSATVIGMVVGAWLADHTGGGVRNVHVAAVTMIGIAIVGTAISLVVQTLPAANPKAPFPRTIIGETIRDIILLAGMGRLFRVALGIIFFWTVAGLAQINIDALSDESGALFESERNPLLVTLTIGVGVGSVLAGIASRGRIELGLVPWGAAGIGGFSMLLAFAPDYFLIESPGHWKLVVACVLLGGLGMSAGFFDVPLASYLQKKSPIEKRGSILSATNCLAFSGIMVASILFGNVFRSSTDVGRRDQLPAEYVVGALSEEEQRQVEEYKMQLAASVNNASVSLTGDDRTANSIELPADLSDGATRSLVTELIWQDVEKQSDAAADDAGKNVATGAQKYMSLFPDHRRQARLVVRAASKQPWFSAREIFFTVGLLTLPVLAYATYRLPQKMARIFFWWLLNILYKTRVRGLENIPEKTGAILAFNHCSWLDGCTILSLNPHPMRTIAWGGNFTNYFIRKWGDFCGVILMGSGPKSIRNGLETAREALKNGELVAIFPEGGITQTGQIRAFKPGLMKILENTDVPVIPCYIDEMWGSIFSYVGGKSLNRFPNSIRRPLSMHIGKPIENPKSEFEVWQAVQRLSAESVDFRAGKFVSAPASLVKNCKRRKFSMKIGDSTGDSLTGGKLLTRVLVVRRLLGRLLGPDEQQVGILIPPSNGGAIVNLAIGLDKRVAINLNYSLSEDLINKCIEKAGIKTVLTSRKVMENFGFILDANVLYLEDARDQVSVLDKAIGAIQSFLVPRFLLNWSLGLNRIKPHDLMTVIFTSGSTGVPKGVMLSHRNVASNMAAVHEAASLGYSDTIVGILPFFHSFGYTAALWLGTACDIRTAYHFSPLDARQVGKLVKRYEATLLIATPTFLRTYMKRCSADEFESLEIVVAGAERLPPELCDAFEQKFGVRPVEGYGATELSPITSVNIPFSRQYDAVKFQVDAKEGTVGRTVKSVACKVTDLDTGEELGPNESGMLWITGPNVMLGYLDQDDLTSQVIKDGWYNTGDVALIDNEGFIKITGRMSRFSKIGGEMVPHIKIEEVLTRLCDEVRSDDDEDDDQPNIAVTSVPDPRKGERLIVLYTRICKSVPELRAGLSDEGLPNIFIPSEDSFRQVDQLPLLGSGKLDLKGLKQMAVDFFGQP